MQIIWTNEGLDDFAQILIYYHEQAGPVTAAAVETQIVCQLEELLTFPERIRKSERIAKARELVIHRLPYIVFVRVRSNEILVLNIVHAARKFPV